MNRRLQTSKKKKKKLQRGDGLLPHYFLQQFSGSTGELRAPNVVILKIMCFPTLFYALHFILWTLLFWVVTPEYPDLWDDFKYALMSKCSQEGCRVLFLLSHALGGPSCRIRFWYCLAEISWITGYAPLKPACVMLPSQSYTCLSFIQ